MSTFQEMTSNAARVAFVKDKLGTDDRWLTRGLSAIYARQTASEQNTESTQDHNKVGFSAFDADFLTKMAKVILAGRTLSPKQMAAVRKSMMKYAGQLVKIAKEKEEAGK